MTNKYINRLATQNLYNQMNIGKCRGTKLKWYNAEILTYIRDHIVLKKVLLELRYRSQLQNTCFF